MKINPKIIFPIIVASSIFFMSSQNGTDSGSQSDIITHTLLDIPFLATVGYETLSLIVRKCAHIFEYILLGVSTTFALQKHENSGKIAFLISVFFAITDEFHQLFVIGRGAQIQDVLIDTLGATIGIFTFQIFHKKFGHS